MNDRDCVYFPWLALMSSCLVSPDAGYAVHSFLLQHFGSKWLFEDMRISVDAAFWASVTIRLKGTSGLHPLGAFFLFCVLVISHVDTIHNWIWECSDPAIFIQTYDRIIYWHPLGFPHPPIITHCLLVPDLYVFMQTPSCSTKLPFSELLCFSFILSGTVVFLPPKDALLLPHKFPFST